MLFTYFIINLNRSSIPKYNVKQKIHFALVSLALFSLVFTGFSSTPPAFAHGIIDQSNFASILGSAPILGIIGQGFTPTADNIIGVDIALLGTCADDWIVTIHEGDIFGTSLVSELYTTDPFVSLQHVDLPFTSLFPGTTYVIEILSMDLSPLPCSWLGATGDPYTGGIAYLPDPFPRLDLDFVTYSDGIGPLPDDDDDGVPNVDDQCPTTPTEASVDADGCADTDGDGVFDSFDQCPTTPTEASIDAEGCEIIDPSTGDEKKNCDKLRENAKRDNGSHEGIKKNALENNSCN